MSASDAVVTPAQLPPSVGGGGGGAGPPRGVGPRVGGGGGGGWVGGGGGVGSAPNDRQVKAIAEQVERAVQEATGDKPLRTEGLDSLRWVLLDYGDLVVHVFLDEERRYYELERLWADVPTLRWDEVEAEERGEASTG